MINEIYYISMENKESGEILYEKMFKKQKIIAKEISEIKENMEKEFKKVRCILKKKSDFLILKNKTKSLDCIGYFNITDENIFSFFSTNRIDKKVVSEFFKAIEKRLKKNKTKKIDRLFYKLEKIYFSDFSVSPFKYSKKNFYGNDIFKEDKKDGLENISKNLSLVFEPKITIEKNSIIIKSKDYKFLVFIFLTGILFICFIFLLSMKR